MLNKVSLIIFSPSQFAVVPFSNEPRIEFRLNAFKDRNSLLRAIRALRYGGGNTRTGLWNTPNTNTYVDMTYLKTMNKS